MSPGCDWRCVFSRAWESYDKTRSRLHPGTDSKICTLWMLTASDIPATDNTMLVCRVVLAGNWYQADRLMCSGMSVDHKNILHGGPHCSPQAWDHVREKRQSSSCILKTCTRPVCFLNFQKQSLIRTWLSEQNYRLLTVWLWTSLIIADCWIVELNTSVELSLPTDKKKAA